MRGGSGRRTETRPDLFARAEKKMPSEENMKARAALTPEDVGEIRNEIMKRVLEDLKIGNVGPMLRSGYTRSEGKNYGSYNQE